MSFAYTITDKENGLALVELEGDLNFKQDATELLTIVEKRIEDGKVNYILSLTKLEHINSSGLNVLIMLLTKARKAGGEIVIIHISPKIQKLFVLTRLNSFFTLKETYEEAISVFTKN